MPLDYVLGSPISQWNGGFLMRLADDARKCVVFFGQQDGPNVRYAGTGFLISHKEGNYKFTYLVTAKHVAEHLVAGNFFMRINTKDGGSERIEPENVRWITHNDPDVDLAITPLDSLPDDADCLLYPTSSFIRGIKTETKNIGPGSLTYTVGLFRLHAGEQRNLPVVHTGHIALDPNDDELIPIKDKLSGAIRQVSGYLVEAQTMEGLSGSPVYVRRSIEKREGIDGEYPKAWVYGAVFLLGLWQGSWDGEPGEILADDRGLEGKRRVPVGMGIVIPAARILEILAYPELKDKRDEYRQADADGRAATLDTSS